MNYFRKMVTRTFPLSDRHDAVVGALGIILVAAVALADAFVFDQPVAGLGYAAVVLLGLAAPQPFVTLIIATAGTLASLAVGVFSAQAGADAAAVAGRGGTLVALWVVAGLIFYLCQLRPAAEPTRELFENDDIFQAIFNQTFQFVAALDSEGNIIEANHTLRDYAGLSASEIQSMPFWMLPIFRNDPEVQERLRTAVDKAGKGDFSRDEFVITGVGDQSTMIDLSLKPIHGTGGVVEQMIMEARDITEVRTQQEMLVQAQKMEAVGELTAGVAHDFNNLLTIIVGNLELLQRQVEGNERAEARLRQAIDAVFRGQALTQQLLAFSRRQPLNPAIIDVNTLLGGMTQIYDALGDAVEVTFELAEDLPPCEVDPVLLETALLNIAINARDAMPHGGRLRVHTARTFLDEFYHGEVSDLPPGPYICIAVSDTGVGIPEAIISQVFDPFFTTKSDGQGTGLGLSMVYGFVKQSGGDIKIYSEVGEGTTIRIYLPATDKEVPEAADSLRADAARREAEGKSILLVEDDEAVMDVILNALVDAGYQVDSVESGDAAIELIRAGYDYDLVFTDVVMAGDAGGTDVARAARAAMPSIPVIFCSGFPRQVLNGEEASIEGAFFLAKPFQQEALVSIVERAFNRRVDSAAGTK